MCNASLRGRAMEHPTRAFKAFFYCLGISFLSMSFLDGSIAVKAPSHKSLLPLYSDTVANQSQATCTACVKRQCHDNHEYCPICEQACKECPEDCRDCREDCAICLESHRELGEGEAVLECNHKFGVDCIKRWESESLHKDCPKCRRVITYKLCALCNSSIHEWEPYCTYDCIYRWWMWEHEKHIFHRRCIEPLARKSAFMADHEIRQVTSSGVTMIIRKGDIAFHCPAKHKKGSGYSTCDLKVPLSKVIPYLLYKDEFFPWKKTSKDISKCDLCHREIKPDQKKCSYTCHYRDYHHRHQDHVFHEACLRPYAERAAYKQVRLGKETGKMVFICPVDHDCGVYYPADDLEVELLHGFKPESVVQTCIACKKDLDIYDPDTRRIEFRGFPGLLSLDIVDEKLYFHAHCFGALVAATAYPQTEGLSKVVTMLPCPCHKGTKWEHAIEIPHTPVVADLPGK